MKLTDLRPCDNCDGPIRSTFYVVRHSIAVVSTQAVNEFVGMHQFFGGKASDALVENFAPSAHDAVKIAMDHQEFKPLMYEFFICHTCFYNTPLDMPMLVEKANERLKKTADAVAKADAV